jgi:1-deoxy-D-xylulose-5-phosphate synthase
VSSFGARAAAARCHRHRVSAKATEGGVAVLTGHIGNYAASATEALVAEGPDIGHYDMRFCKPL